MLGVNKRKYVFIGPDEEDGTDLPREDLMHNIYLGLFKHMIEWVEAFLKRAKQQQALDNAGKEIPPYLGSRIQTKAYWEMRQWHLQESRKLGLCVEVV